MVSISNTIARQIGSLQGKLTTQVQGEVLSLLKKFSNQCPSPIELQKIIAIRNTLITHLDSFQKRVDRFSKIIRRLERTAQTIRITIKTIKAIPIPTAIIPPMVGGIGIPIRILTIYSDVLIKLNKTLDRIVDEITAVKSLTGSVTPIISNLKTSLQSLDLAIQKCSESQPGNLSEIIATTQPPENTGSEGTPNQNYIYTSRTTGDTYTLAIQQDRDSVKIAPRRFATATDRRGIVVLRGPSSFSSSTQVLLDEIKFRIDQLL